MISKYSGIETYFEEAGPRLAAMGHEVVVYCRTHFTPAVAWHKGMRVVRLPTIRSKHFETAIHTCSEHHPCRSFAGCDVVHYHALGPALLSFLPRLFGKKTVVTVQGLDGRRKKWGAFASFVLRCGERAAARFPDQTMVVSKTLHEYFRESYGVDTAYVPNGAIYPRSAAPARTYILRRGLKPVGHRTYLFPRPVFARKKLPPADRGLSSGLRHQCQARTRGRFQLFRRIRQAVAQSGQR